MTAAVTRELKLTYGGVVLGGTTDRLIQGGIRLRQDDEQATISCEFVTTAATEAAIISEQQTLEAAFKKPRQDLTVDLGSTEWLAFKESAGTGFNHAATIAVIENSPANTGRSRAYRVEITVDLPWPINNARKTSTIDFAVDTSGIATLTVAGVYTNSGTTSARSQYEAQIGAYFTSITASGTLNLNWELISEQAVTDDADSECSFVRVYRELIFNQASGTLDNTNIKNQTLTVSRSKFAPGDVTNANANRLMELRLAYNANIDKSQTTGLTALWTGTIRPYLIAHAKTISGLGTVALVQDSPQFDSANNTISAEMVFSGVVSSGVLVAQVSTIDETFTGAQLIGAWSGRGTDHVLFQGPEVTIRTVTEAYTVIAGSAVPQQVDTGAPGTGGGGGGGGGGAGTPSLYAPGGTTTGSLGTPGQGFRAQQGGSVRGDATVGNGWVLLRQRVTPPVRRTIGFSGNSFDVEDHQRVTVMQYATAPRN